MSGRSAEKVADIFNDGFPFLFVKDVFSIHMISVSMTLGRKICNSTIFHQHEAIYMNPSV